MPDLSHSFPNDGQGFAASTSTAVDGRGDASTLQEPPWAEQVEDLICQCIRADRLLVAAEAELPRDFDYCVTRAAAVSALRKRIHEALAARASTPVGWQPIETAPKDGRTLLLGYFNTRGKWRALRGQWISADEIAETWEDDECAEGWYETSVECEADVSAWPTNPTHWQPIAAPSATPESTTPEQAQ